MRRVRGREIAMVFQEPMTSLNPVLTVVRQLTEGLEIHLGADAARARARAEELLSMVGIPDPARRLSQYPHQFSGGMRQRMIIAMALGVRAGAGPRGRADHGPRRDDPGRQVASPTSVVGVARRTITYNLGVVASRRYADRVNVMYAGRIIEQGTAREADARPRHPYTLGLLRSVPRLDAPRRARLDPIDGQPPDLLRLPSGCAFTPRCAFRVERCLAERPEVRPAGGDGHVSACWEIERLPDTTGSRRGHPVSAAGGLHRRLHRGSAAGPRHRCAAGGARPRQALPGVGASARRGSCGRSTG